MLIIGLTGSIATGKSTVSKLLSQQPYSLPIIDADLLARQVVEPGTQGYNAIVAYFSATTPDLLLPPAPDSTSMTPSLSQGQPLNRPALGRRIFGDDDKRKKDRAVLNSIVHPAVRLEIFKAVCKYYILGYWAVVLDVPLLFEGGLDILCGVVIVVGVRDAELQMRRLRARNEHLSVKEAENRVKSQGNVMDKVRRVSARGDRYGVVVWNDGDMDDLKVEVAEALEGVRKQSPWWWGILLWVLPPIASLAGASCICRGWIARKRWEDQRQPKKAKS